MCDSQHKGNPLTYVHYGCGLCAPKEWLNFDASPSLRIQRIPLLGQIFRSLVDVPFPANVRYGDIVKGLPIAENSCEGVFCSHILEHLSLEDFRTALRNTYKVLGNNGKFRCVVPDLERGAREYVKSLDDGDSLASVKFVGANTLLGLEKRPRGLLQFLQSFLGNSRHLWMWDCISLSRELQEAGFRQIRVCRFNDSDDRMFRLVEDYSRFQNAVSIECTK